MTQSLRKVNSKKHHLDRKIELKPMVLQKFTEFKGRGGATGMLLKSPAKQLQNTLSPPPSPFILSTDAPVPLHSRLPFPVPSRTLWESSLLPIPKCLCVRAFLGAFLSIFGSLSSFQVSALCSQGSVSPPEGHRGHLAIGDSPRVGMEELRRLCSPH